MVVIVVLLVLDFEVDGVKYRIGRFLRRVGLTIGQEAGFLPD